MRKVLKSGAVSVSEDVLHIRDAVPRVNPSTERAAAALAGQVEPQTEEVSGEEENAVAELILQKAAEQADRIIRDAAQRAEEQRASVLQQARLEAEKTREQAVLDGKAEGARSQLYAIQSSIGEMEFAVSRLEGEQAGFIAEYEQNLKWLALEIASKVLNKRLEENDAELLELVQGAVNTVKSAEWITVQVSESMPKLLDALAHSLAIAEGKVEVRDIPAPAGTCVVETPTSVVDASLYVQLENLKEYFKNE